MNERHQTALAENTPGALNPNLAAARSRQLNCAEGRQGELPGGDVVMWNCWSAMNLATSSVGPLAGFEKIEFVC